MMFCAMPIQGGPYLAGAFFCEKALKEQDQVCSFIRVVDRFIVSGPDDVMPQASIQVTLVVMFKSGIHRGSSQLTITPVSPSDVVMPALPATILFEGDDDRGQVLVQPMVFPATEPGTYWFNVSIDGRSFTEIPLRVVYHKVAVQAFPPNFPPSL